jgi:hypothetical protein
MKLANLKNGKSTYRTICELVILVLIVWSIGACSKDDNGTNQEPPPQLKFGKVSGAITDTDGQPYRHVDIMVEDSGQVLKSGMTNDNGNYQLNQVPVGTHQIRYATPLGTAAVENNPASITIGENTTTEKDFSFSISPVPALLVAGAVDILDEMMNATRGEPTDPSELLYTPMDVNDPNSPLVPILAPDGHHITFGEWREASGFALVACEGVTSKYTLEFTGLIPNGVYTIWNFVLLIDKSPGQPLDFSTDFTGAGALGDGTSNVMVASPAGTAALQLNEEPGPLSMFGSQPACVITAAPAFILVVNYHIDGQTHGGVPGPDKDDVAQMLIYY